MRVRMAMRLVRLWPAARFCTRWAKRRMLCCATACHVCIGRCLSREEVFKPVGETGSTNPPSSWNGTAFSAHAFKGLESAFLLTLILTLLGGLFLTLIGFNPQ